ncbi:MAG: tetraacyldisaccharide 4'-kinase [Muribaculaceae bacterium]|nr:tetraacyldisaccharide 4'-kinase [Muribaculaceae bacterium]
MKASIHKILPYILKPLSWIYGGITGVRNWMFDHKILVAEEFDVPIVSIGNITVGGTGKTPHVEYVAGMISSSYNIAVLSRGYKRKTKGFILANDKSTPDTIGDEPLQIYRKLGPRVKVAVCENRRKGIKEIMSQFPDTQLILLDDAYQHRYVKPKINVLLMDYNRPVYDDHLLPLGRLRESAHQTHRADMVIVTKCPRMVKPLDLRLISKQLALMPYQKLYFSNYEYGDLTPVFPNDRPYYVDLNNLNSEDSVMLVTGIANPRGFIRHFNRYPFKVVIAHYPDHHDFTRADIKELSEKFAKMPGRHKIMITTEKDAIRLAYNPYFPAKLKPSVYYVPISVKMVQGLENTDIISDLCASLGH